MESSRYRVTRIVPGEEFIPLEDLGIITKLLHPILGAEEDLEMPVIRQTQQRIFQAAETGAILVLVENVHPPLVVGIANLTSICTITNGHTGMIVDFAVNRNREHVDQLALAEAIMRPLIEHAKTINMRWIIAEPHELYQHQTYDNFGFITEGDGRMRLTLEG